MSTQAKFSGDSVIVGGGMAGLSLAIALHKAGLKVAVVDAAPLDSALTPEFDGRASALAYTSWRMLDSIGVAEHLAPHAQRIEDILVVDGRPNDGLRPGGPGRDSLHFDRREIHSGEDGEPLGWMAENRWTRVALARTAEACGLSVFAPAKVDSMSRQGARARVHLDDGSWLEGAVVIACDGKFSRLREQAGIRTTGREYGQKALVATVAHALPHEGVAYEFFMPAGPFAILPLPDNRSSLVWTEKAAAADALRDMDPAGFQEALEARFGDFLGALRPEGPRWTYPLGLKMSERFIDDRLALVGDAARAIHPIAGQGFNLGLRDAAALADCLVEAKRAGLDLGSPAVLEGYERWRKGDSALLGIGTDFFNLLFSNDHTSVRAMRGFGLGLVDKIAPARRFFMRQAGGETGDLPGLLKGEALSL